MAGRYDKRAVYRNSHFRYMEYFIDRSDQTITNIPVGTTQWATPNIRYPTAEEINEFNVFDHVWKRGDRFFKLAHKHYGDSKLWWIIPWFNKKPLVSDYKFGDLVYIPLSISQVYNYFD